MHRSSPTENHDAFAPPSGGLSPILALSLGAVLFPVLAVVNYQIGVYLIRLHKFSWPTMDHPATLLAFAFSGAVMLIGFWYHTRPERLSMLRGMIGIVLCAIGTFYVVWALALSAMGGVMEIRLTTPEIQMLILGAIAAGAGALTINLRAKPEGPPISNNRE